jgi:hypothetical protein
MSEGTVLSSSEGEVKRWCAREERRRYVMVARKMMRAVRGVVCG